MKIYYFNKQTLEYRPIMRFGYSVVVLITILIGLLFIGNKAGSSTDNLVNPELVLLSKGVNPFTEQKLLDKIRILNFRFPHIVYAQSKLETGNYKSKIFFENNNLFGMKEAQRRINLAKGTQFNHAYYDTWEESLTDYAFWYSTYASKCVTEEHFFSILGSQYAEDTSYVQNLKRIIKEENLLTKF